MPRSPLLFTLHPITLNESPMSRIPLRPQSEIRTFSIAQLSDSEANSMP